jgi:hypothetical protein
MIVVPARKRLRPQLPARWTLPYDRVTARKTAAEITALGQENDE